MERSISETTVWAASLLALQQGLKTFTTPTLPVNHSLILARTKLISMAFLIKSLVLLHSCESLRRMSYAAADVSKGVLRTWTRFDFLEIRLIKCPRTFELLLVMRFLL